MSSVISITAALKQRNVPLHAQSILQMMIWAGLAEEKQYVSSSGSGEIKQFYRLTDHGLQFGRNVSTLSPTKTEIKIFPHAIFPILKECHVGLGAFVAKLEATTSESQE